MYLKSIEVQGFKSFADRIVLKFNDGITGIVGPNGSGKSNVADAVRWVLGEQRIKQLRSESMTDVIFSGTEIRKPMSSAFVSITFDNSDHALQVDYDEVTVSRRLYRSGESEYMINGSNVRLRDVNELFYDTGIGKEGYSIIGQGQIDRIMSSRPEDRRELFDEAAGIVKYKVRKNASEKKLESEKQNRLRVTDILNELENQRAPLEKQADKARKYLDKREKLKNLEVNEFLEESRTNLEEIEKLKNQATVTEQDLETSKADYEGAKKEYDKVEIRIAELDRQIEEDRNALSNGSLTASRLEGEINVLREKIRASEGNRQHFEERISQIRGDLDGLKAQEDEARGRRDDARESLDALSEESGKAAERLSGIQKEMDSENERSETLNAGVIELLGKRADIKSRIEALNEHLRQCTVRESEINSRVIQTRTDEAEIKGRIDKLVSDFERIGSEIKAMDARKKEIEESLSTFRDRLSSLDRKLTEARAAYHQDRSRLDAMSDIVSRYEGYGQGVRFVMDRQNEYPGIKGAVSDIISTDKKYETAIETALGASIQNIVTDNEITARDLINDLKRNKGGRVTFMPLTSIKPSKPIKEKDALREKGSLGTADTLVSYDPEYENVASSLLGRILVAEDVDSALRIAKKYDYNLRIVTLQGELLIPGGSISGGAYNRRDTSLLSRKRMLDELRKKVKEDEKNAEKAAEDIENTKKERTQMREELAGHDSNHQKKLIEQNTVRMELEKERERQKSNENSAGSLEEEKLSLKEEIAKVNKEKEEAAEALDLSRKEEEALNESIRESAENLASLREKETKAKEETGEFEIELTKKRQALEYEQKNLDRISGESEKLSSDLKEAEESLKGNEDEAEFRRESIETIKGTIEAAKKAQEEAGERLKENQELKEKLAAGQKDFFERRETLSNKMSGLDKELLRLQNRLERLNEGMEEKVNYMWDEYQLTVSEAQELDIVRRNDLPAMKKEITSLKNEIRSIGDVNVGAIEDYRVLMERYNFLKKQHDDIIKSEEDLRQVIEELQKLMTEQFSEKFEGIKKEFDRVFIRLFGGGHGRIELTNDEDILESGIQIIAQPPGKKLTNMMQMSGGEKALTAICLLFAIQNLKPSPFCLLDEIEAALDENNVNLFAEYLKSLADNTQFIVITHRRGTMDGADRLYGITMQEKGVSVMVSVDLVEKDLK